MPLTFPSNPTVNQTYTFNAVTWIWTGTRWEVNTVPGSPAQYDAQTSSTGYFDLPSGTTAQRPASPGTGMARFNTSTGAFEFYASDWVQISGLGITSVSPTSFSGASGTSFTITGSGFTAGTSVRFITNSGSIVTAATVTINNLNSIIATTPRAFTVSEEPLDVQVVSPSGITVTLQDVIDCGGSPSWSTASGAIYSTSLYENELLVSNTALVATDPDGSTVTYSVTSGSLPSGISLSSSGVLTGTAPTLATDTTYNFTVTASDPALNSTSRAFNIQVLNDTSLDYTSNLRLWMRAGYNGATAGVIATGTDTLSIPIKGTTSGTINTIGTVSRVVNTLTASPVDGTKYINDSFGGATAALQNDKLAFGIDSGDSIWVQLSSANPILDSTTTNHTFCYWIMWENRSENTGSNLFNPMFHSWTSPSFIAHDWYTNGTSNLYMQHYANGALQGTFNTPNIAGGLNGNKGVWFHFAVVNTSSSTKFYINGSESTGHSVSAVTTWPSIGNSSVINFNGRGDGLSGSLPGNYTSGYSGFKNIADIRYYNAALSAAAISAIYAKSRSNLA